MPTVFDQLPKTPVKPEIKDDDDDARSTSQRKRTEYPTPPGIEMSEIFPGVVKPVIEETIIEWRSPSRAFKKRQKKYFTTMATIVLLLSLILVFSGQILTVAVVLAVAFMAYVMTSVPPHEIFQKITTYGLRLEKELYYWEELGRFWFEIKHDQIVLKIEVSRFPKQLMMVINNEEEKVNLKAILSEVLLNQKPQPTLAEKIGNWLQKKFPLELEGS